VHNNKLTRLVTSAPYRQLWGERFMMIKTGERRLENNMTGFKLATSVTGVATGERGDRVLLDDPHNVIKAESEAEREKTVRFVRESMWIPAHREDPRVVRRKVLRASARPAKKPQPLPAAGGQTNECSLGSTHG
jgi:hypothetical protein